MHPFQNSALDKNGAHQSVHSIPPKESTAELVPMCANDFGTLADDSASAMAILEKLEATSEDSTNKKQAAANNSCSEGTCLRFSGHETLKTLDGLTKE